MGLITKEVQVSINTRNIKHLESKGYEIPRNENKNGKLDSYEKIKMYNLCGLKDTTEYLSALSLEKGIEKYTFTIQAGFSKK